ncbi:MAG: hypothetical protein GY716_23380 [bacterium]|nr:hypothetical protein [bacterium]
MKTILASMAILVAVSASWADVRVEIVDHPAQVLQWSPVLITAQIVNDGPDAAIVPTGRWMQNGYFVETGPSDGELSAKSLLTGSDASTNVRKLQPGSTWLFQIDVREWMSEPGHYRARVGVHGGGRCFLEKAVAEDLGATAIAQKRRARKQKGPKPYECWEGSVFSQEVTVQVDEPTSTVDREALKYIQSPDYPVAIGGFFRVMHGARYLKERFPESHYTYVSVFYSGGDFDWLLRVQPDHPLTPYTRMKAVMGRSQKSGWCSESATAYASELQLRPSLEQYALQMVREMRASR